MTRYLNGGITILLIVAFSLAGGRGAGAHGPGEGEEPGISAASAVLMDQESRRVLWERDIHQARPIASVTKIMTALLALELGEQQELVVVGPGAAHTEGSSIWLEEGEEKTLEELLFGLMLCSGNDAAVAIAEHLTGSVGDFSLLMTAKARQLGAVNSHFTNPHGLPDDRHYSTAYDLALISCRALDDEIFRNMIATDYRIITWPGKNGRYLKNQNRLLELYPGADGIKTGWTRKAGRCFAGSATRNGWQLVTVVLDAPQMWEDTIELLDYGYCNYSREKIFGAGQILIQAAVDGRGDYVGAVAAKDFYLTLLPGERERLHYRWRLQDSYISPIGCGERLGRVEIYLDGLLMGIVPLNAGHEVKKLSLWNRFSRLARRLLAG